MASHCPATAEMQQSRPPEKPRDGSHNAIVLMREVVSTYIDAGTIARTCAATGVGLHLVGPLGFEIESSRLKRAGLDYWPYVAVNVYSTWKVSFWVALMEKTRSRPDGRAFHRQQQHFLACRSFTGTFRSVRSQSACWASARQAPNTMQPQVCTLPRSDGHSCIVPGAACQFIQLHHPASAWQSEDVL